MIVTKQGEDRPEDEKAQIKTSTIYNPDTTPYHLMAAYVHSDVCQPYPLCVEEKIERVKNDEKVVNYMDIIHEGEGCII